MHASYSFGSGLRAHVEIYACTVQPPNIRGHTEHALYVVLQKAWYQCDLTGSIQRATVDEC